MIKRFIFKLKIIVKWYWCKLIEDRMVLHNCKCWCVNVITKDMYIVKPKLSIKRTWYGKVTGEHKTIKKLPLTYYFKALNEKNATRKAANILKNFYNNVQ